MRRPTILDLCCGAGGAMAGYADAGFDVVGVDIVEQENYPSAFHLGDALTVPLDGFDAIHASPPCQNYCWSTSNPRKAGRKYPDLIAEIRCRLVDSGVPFVIENVPNAPLHNPTYLEGDMFGLGVIRRRCFETNWWLPQPMYIKHKPKRSVLSRGKRVRKSSYCSVAGNGGDGWSCRVADWRVAMGIDWMTRTEIKQAIPPAYTRYIGRYLMMLL